MLSVRNLAKIASKKASKIANGSRKGLDATALEDVILPGLPEADVEMPAAGISGALQPSASGKRKAMIKMGSPQKEAPAEEVVEEAPSEPALRCELPSCAEIVAYVRETLEEAQRQGAVELLLALALLYSLIRGVRWMLH